LYRYSAEKERVSEEASAKINNLTKLILVSSTLDEGSAAEAVGRQKRGSRRETWCPKNRSGGAVLRTS
jgi:hypothetical protein